MIQVYTGNGKGKTTCAIGAATRAAGHDKKILIIQFLKGNKTGEFKSLNKLNVKVVQFGIPCVRINEKSEITCDKCGLCNKNIEENRKLVEEAFDYFIENYQDYDIIILDEINNAFDRNLINHELVKRLIKNIGINKEIILTGRNAHNDIIKIADLVTEMKEIKHPFNENILARQGIEY